MLKRLPNRMLLLAVLAVSILLSFTPTIAMSAKPTLLTEPFLQLPTESSVRVVWFTKFAGAKHTVAYGAGLSKQAIAQTTQLSRTREDSESKRAVKYTSVTVRPIWRHEAEVIGLKSDQSVRYQVTSVREDGIAVNSAVYNLTAKPSPGKPLKILLTSDHQVKPMVAANLQKVVETVGQVDLVLFAGDLINVADRASEWFDDNCGGSFFPALQGRACYDLEKNGIKTRYNGGAILQNAPMYTAIGNHEVMGRFSNEEPLNEQFYNTVPYEIAEVFHDADFRTINPTNDPVIHKKWVKDHSFNTDTYEEIFTLPQSPQGGKRYYAETFGDMRLVVLYITNVWRVPSLAADAKGKYRERDQDIKEAQSIQDWGWGQHLFEPIAKGTPQYNWLEQELNSPEFKQAKYKLVMFHHPPHSLGENIVPAYTDPVQIMDTEEVEVKPDGLVIITQASPRNQSKPQIDTSKPFKQTVTKAIRYEYPIKDDYIIRDVVPLLEKANVQLVFYGHSHLWNRFVSPSGMHFLETSNVGNSYGAFVGDRKRNVPTGYKEDYAATGDPNGLEPILPTITPLLDAKKQPMSYVASNDITVFSIFDTGTGTISSYRFDTRDPKSAVVKFDEFTLKK
ncbi:metallophosphoesterase family protein [Leptolyngbya sp. FACHB-321]|uniref:purple acid phosphatase family protein n=1 Tax=Leptolyngbya sp. FACHB-321 TaxID=2692807 RepID=UPI001687B404|nr:metallophosphoesterase family protein [Leptolyngbya sp. FACHB-321]MBD2038688.1 metallophosphoesterase family protein [Leptolyngbya sp. FACHB-321]